MLETVAEGVPTVVVVVLQSLGKQTNLRILRMVEGGLGERVC